MMGWFSCLCSLLLLFLCTTPSNSSSSPATPLCHPHENTALLRFKNSFSITNDSSYISYCFSVLGNAYPNNSTVSWKMAGDCCRWSGVTCDEVTGHVISLHLRCSGLQGVIDSNNSLFSLSHLQTLDLSINDFEGSAISTPFGRFQSLIYLDLSSSGFTGQVPAELAYLSNLLTLDLSFNLDLELETSVLKRIVANLTSLEELVLGGVDMSKVLPNSFMNLSETLTNLDVGFSKLKGEFPENIFNLPNLEVLSLYFNPNLIGSFPQHNWTSPLRDLRISRTGFSIDLLYLTRNLKYLNVLYARNCSFIGSFPALLGNFTQITYLDISANNFVGQFPWAYLNLEKLASLDLSTNNFVGQLPEICSNSTENTFSCDSSKHQLVGPLPSNLQSLTLSDNSFNGTIPSWLYSLPSLQFLYLADNEFTGHIGDFQYNSLEVLHLSSNKLHGLIPRSIFHQVNLTWLDLSSNNFSGVVMLEQFSKLNNLLYLALSINSLSVVSLNHTSSTLSTTLWALHLSSCNISEFPYSIRRLENLVVLDLSNNQIEGSVPKWLWDVGKESLITLDISHNFLTHMGPIPWSTLEYIDLQSNQLQGHLPIPPPSTLVFSVANNQLVGEISSLICNLSMIEVLNLSNNSLSGNIPPCVGNFGRTLFILDLHMNKFCGTIPPAFAKGNSLRTLKLNENQFEGSLPRSLLNCEKLEVLDVGNNKMNGSFPFWLESLPELQVLILRSNRFYGLISNPKIRSPFQKLRIIDLSNNEFTGPLPGMYFEKFKAMSDAHTSDHLEYMTNYTVGGYYYQDSVRLVIKGYNTELVKILKTFIAIDLSKNNFTGEIPYLIGKLHSLKGLNFSYNKLTGVIPKSFGNLSNLEWLDLTSNELVGEIPWQLAAYLNQLQILNLSSNKLEGPIPRGPQFDTFKDDAYGENPLLCGIPLSKSCSEKTTPKEEGGEDEEHDNSMFDWKVMMMGYGSGLVIGISVGYMVFFSRSFEYWLIKRFGGQMLQWKTNARLRGRRRPN